jgi:hypothetical protein
MNFLNIILKSAKLSAVSNEHVELCTNKIELFRQIKMRKIFESRRNLQQVFALTEQLEKWQLDERAVFRIRIRTGSRFNQVSRSVSNSGFGIRVRIQEGKNDPKNRKTYRNFMFRSAGVLFLRLKASSVARTSFTEA